ncbi:ribokinase [Alkalibacter mobilis]|uniref:ribokinase n=1 Tax=Alkalibacter mobilis TaxID=2787712 RepID=UPI00189D229A|nr:ribokinase [Alkalibacter mobilis]MBF7095577.1 ribokinase [Alkalibacter mobilis]
MITVVGSLNMDLVITAPTIPRPGETVLGTSFKQIPGGKGANQADAAAKLKADVTMIGAVGKDSMGEQLKRSLESDGVDVQRVLEKDDYSTGVAAIIVEEKGNNAIAVAPGANYGLTPEDIENMEECFKKTNVMIVQLETPLETVRKALKMAKDFGAITILNPAPARELDEEILSLTDILTPNETELEILSGLPTDNLDDIQIAAEKLMEKGVKEMIVTLGGQGCMHITKENISVMPAYKVKVVDTTAAGDSFNGAIGVALDEGKTMEEALKFAMKVGAMTVSKAGAQTSLPYLNEVENFDQWYEKMSILED